MIRHIVLLNWQENVSPSQIDAVNAAFSTLAAKLEQPISYHFGQDAGLYRGNADYAVIADFQNELDFKAYVADPEHQELMRSVTGPIMASYQALQLMIEP